MGRALRAGRGRRELEASSLADEIGSAEQLVPVAQGLHFHRRVLTHLVLRRPTRDERVERAIRRRDGQPSVRTRGRRSASRATEALLMLVIIPLVFDVATTAVSYGESSM